MIETGTVQGFDTTRKGAAIVVLLRDVLTQHGTPATQAMTGAKAMVVRLDKMAARPRAMLTQDTQKAHTHQVALLPRRDLTIDLNRAPVL